MEIPPRGWSTPGERGEGKKQTAVEFVVLIEEEAEPLAGGYDRCDPQPFGSHSPELASVGQSARTK